MSKSVSSPESRLRALCDVTRTITASLQLDDVLRRICESATELLRADAALITRLQSDLDGAEILEVQAVTPDARVRPGEALALGGSLSGRAITESRTLIVNDVANDERADRPMAREAQVNQAVIAPLIYQDVALGTIAVWNTTDGEDFDELDGELLSALAAQAAIAIRNADIFQAKKRRGDELGVLKSELEENVRRLRGLVRAGMALNSHLSLDEVLQTLVDSAREVLAARYAALGVLDRTGSELARFLHSGIDAATADRIGPLPTGQGILGLIIREERSLRLRDLREHPASCGFPDGHPPMSSFLGVPVRAGGRVFGNLYLTEKQGAHEFSAEDEELAELLAAQAAVAIENANLYEQRNQFLAIVNHEIKNAAAGVLGWTDRLRSLTIDEDRKLRESAEYALQGARGLHKLVVDLLDLSQIEARRLELDRREVDLRALVREVAAAVRPTAEELGIEIDVEGLDQRAVTETDPARVRQILLNLLSNALKFTDDGGRVTLQLHFDRNGWSIFVRDSGPGIDRESRRNIFEIQVSQSKKSGSGLGLAISRELARLLGGDLSVEDSDAGASFRLSMPSSLAVTDSRSR